MSAQRIESSSESSSSEDDGQGRAQLTLRPKRKKEIRSSAWTFRSDIQTDLLSAEGVPVDEKTKLLSEHIRTRISHTQPHAVVCVIAFCNMSKAITRLPHESPSISIPVVWFVQSHQCTAYMMRNWLQEAWEPLPGGLADSPQFLDFSQRAASLESSWFRLGIFGALGLNNRARADARTERKVLRPLPALAQPRVRLVPPLLS